MSLQQALDYFQFIRTSESGHATVDMQKSQYDLNDLVQSASRQGYDFTVDELRKAYKIDWNMRARYYSQPLIGPLSS